jgi:serine/threonine-protein kinase
MIYGLSRQGWFFVQKDATGLLWEEDWPVCKVTFHDALAYVSYLSEKTGKEWMLPDEIQWEKSARGVDKRCFPWGSFMDPAWTCMRQSHKANQKPQTIHQSSIDISPFGVYGMGGNARDITSTPFSIEGPLIEKGRYTAEKVSSEDRFCVVRGGSWYDNEQLIRSCSRSSEHQLKGSALLSFRLIRVPNW